MIAATFATFTVALVVAMTISIRATVAAISLNITSVVVIITVDVASSRTYYVFSIDFLSMPNSLEISCKSSESVVAALFS